MKTRKLIFAALMAAITCVATMVIKIPTPTMGYIHPGDAVVLLSGFLLGPVYGGLSAGIGSMFADVFCGYFSYAPATLIIKFLTALFAGLCFRAFSGKISGAEHRGKRIALAGVSGIIGEAFMVLGYFVFEIFLMAFSTGDGFSASSISAGIAASAAGIPFNMVQGIFGTITAAILLPFLEKPFRKFQ